jgi:hypothetical protein
VHVPPALSAVARRALAKDPADRYPSGGAMADAIAAAVILGGSGQVTVPRLVALTGGQVRVRGRSLALLPSFRRAHSRTVAAGRVISQSPRPGRGIAQGGTIQLVISSGPPPVRVPDLGGESAAEAQSRLAAAGLRAQLRTTVAPRVPAGVVYSQSPAPGTMLNPSRPVSLAVAETPHWQPVTSLSGGGRTTTASFRIRGSRWRVVYRMSYVGTCTFILFCSGPSASAESVGSGSTAGSFDLSDGGRQTRQFTTGPGSFQLRISPGSDTARWTAWIEDSY